MNISMIKKVGGGLLAIGGLLAVIGTIGFVINVLSLSIKAIMDMAVLARVGAIIAFVAAIIILAAAFMGNLKKGAAITGAFFAVTAFIAQFIIDPMTSLSALGSAALSGSSTPGAVVFGFILMFIAGIGSIVTGIINAAAKSNA